MKIYFLIILRILEIILGLFLRVWLYKFIHLIVTHSKIYNNTLAKFKRISLIKG